MAQLTCQNLRVGYDGKSVLQDLSFEVFAGDYLCIVGENGSGKSTLMKTILGLQPHISGRILTGDGLRKNEIGYLPQQTVVQKDFPASVREIVLSGCQGRCGSRPFYNKEEKQLAEENLRKSQNFFPKFASTASIIRTRSMSFVARKSSPSSVIRMSHAVPAMMAYYSKKVTIRVVRKNILPKSNFFSNFFDFLRCSYIEG